MPLLRFSALKHPAHYLKRKSWSYKVAGDNMSNQAVTEPDVSLKTKPREGLVQAV